MATKAATPKAENIETVEKTAKARLQDTRETLGHVGKALNQSGRAYYAGIMELGRFAGGVGREVVSEAGEHLRATVRAKAFARRSNCRPRMSSTASRCRPPMARNSSTLPMRAPKM